MRVDFSRKLARDVDMNRTVELEPFLEAGVLHRETIRFALHPMQGLLYQCRGFAKLGFCCCGADAANSTEAHERKTIKHG